MKGTYILLIKLLKNQAIAIGKLGNLTFENGYYAYIGSALNGLENRIDRHLKSNKKKILAY
jgi:Uri superfamily endonuclease